MLGYVHTRAGKARVNWYEDNKLGVTYCDKSGYTKYPVFYNVLREDQVEFRYGDIPKSSEKPDVKKESEETLRERLKRLRRERRNYGKRRKKSKSKKKSSKKSTKKSSKKSTKKSSKKKSSKSVEDIKKSLSKEELDKLKDLF